MDEFLTSSVVHMLPYYLLAFVVGELLLLLKERRGLLPEIILALILCVVITILGQFQMHSWAAEHRPMLLATVNFLIVMLPVILFVGANQYIVRISNFAFKHGALLAIVVVTMFFWPLWALYVTCASGLDCL